MTVEREAKLPASTAFRVPSLAGVAPGVEVREHEPVTLHTVYYDAPDLRLLRAGGSLRYREGQEWTVKLPTEGPAARLLVREEIGFADDGGIVPADAMSIMRAYLRTADVVPVLRLRTERRRWEVEADGRILVEVVDDDVEVVSGAPGRVRFRELEVERRDDGRDAEAVLDAVVERLRAAGAGEPDPTPKPVRALGAIATAPPDVVVAKLSPEPTAAEVVRRAVAASVRHLILHDPIVRLDTDPEGVHQARVATRRVRSDLRTFAPLLERAWTQRLRAELAWLAAALGGARDADVLLERLRQRVERLSPAERPAGALVVGALETRDKEAHAALMQALTSPRYAALLDALVAAANGPAVTEDASRPAAEAMPRLVRRPWKRLRATVRAAGREPSAASLHEIRIAAKRVRYAAEAVAPVGGRDARRLAAAAANLQEVLGDHQDAMVAAAWLRSWAATGSSDVAFAAGVLAGHEEAAAAASAVAWRGAWRALDRRELRSWM